MQLCRRRSGAGHLAPSLAACTGILQPLSQSDKWQECRYAHIYCQTCYDALMHTVALVVFDRISPFEMAVPCEVFGADRSDMGLPNYRFLVCAAEEGLLRTDAGFGIVAPRGLDGLREAQTVVVPAWRDVDEAAPPRRGAGSVRQDARGGESW